MNRELPQIDNIPDLVRWLETKFQNMEARLEAKIDAKFQNMEARLEAKIDARLDHFENELNELKTNGY